MKRIKFIPIIIITIGILILNTCEKSFLDIPPGGAISDYQLATYDGIDALLIGAYSMVDGLGDIYRLPWWNLSGYTGTSTSGWVLSSIRGMEANKGTDANDLDFYADAIMTYSEWDDWYLLEHKWKATFDAILCCNATILAAKDAEEKGNITPTEAESFISQARALRGFFHFEAWRLWSDSTGAYVPYVDEHTDQLTLTNTEDIRPNIIEDLASGTELPNDMKQVGRFNKTVSQVLLVKAYMQMYNDYASALPLLAEVETSGTNPAGQKAGLLPKYGDVFNIEKRNDIESIYTVQYSVNDGSGGFNGGWGEVLNFPFKWGESPAGCCGFFQPTQDFVNSFRTDAYGLPYIDTYNSEKVTNDQGLEPWDPFTEYAGRLDPRLDWSVGRRGIPYWDWGEHTGKDWIRDQSYAGPYSPKKQVYKKSQEGTYTEVGNWTTGFTANGYRLIRYADVLLLKAECEAMTNSDDRGMGEVNAVRARAANPDSFVKESDGVTNAANYVIGLYPASQFADQESAMKAIKFERRLELGQEGHRYYDLQRWGDVVTELSRILAYEKTMEWGGPLYGGATVGLEDVNYPVPLTEINNSNGRFVQNR